jgi:hypothetical protein
MLDGMNDQNELRIARRVLTAMRDQCLLNAKEANGPMSHVDAEAMRSQASMLNRVLAMYPLCDDPFCEPHCGREGHNPY